MPGDKEAAWIGLGLGLGGAFLGGLLLGPFGASLGWFGGTILGQLLFPQKNEMENLNTTDYGIQTSCKGLPIPKVYGTRIVAGNIIWMGELHPYTVEHDSGGKGGGPQAEYSETRYRRSFLIALCYGPASVLRAWKGKDEIAVTDFTWFPGISNIGVSALIDEDFATYKRVALAFFDEYDLGNFSGIPNFTFEVSSYAIGNFYKYLYFSANATVYGVPLQGRTTLHLDADSAVNVGGGIVGINVWAHPFEIGEQVLIHGTSHYEGLHTLTAGTTPAQLQFSDTYQAETFDGTETVIKQITALPSGAGRCVRDAQGNLYYGHNRVNDGTGNYWVTKVAPDNTESPDYEWLNKTWNPVTGTCMGLAITPDDRYLYMWLQVDDITDYGYMFKFDLTTGDEVWGTTAVYGTTSWPGYDMAIDVEGNGYAPTQQGCLKVDADTGGVTFLASPSLGIYEVTVVDDAYIIILGGYQIGGTYNLCVKTVDDFELPGSATMAVGGMNGSNTWIIGTECLVYYQGYIYVVSYTPTATLYKIQYDYITQTLTEIDSVAVDSSACGIYVSPQGDIVVVVQSAAAGKDDVFHYYNTDLTYISKIENLPHILSTWNAAAGGAWLQGNVMVHGEAYSSKGDLDVNFALMIWDLVRDTLYGGSIPEEALDTDSFQETIDYCEEHDLKGSIVLSQQKPLWDWVSFICTHFDGYRFRTNGLIGLGMFRPRTADAALTRDDIVAAEGAAPVNVKVRPYTDTFNQIEIRWTDRDATYASDLAIARDVVDQRVSGTVRKKTIDLNGITRPALAQYMADRVLIAALYKFKFYNYDVSYRQMALETADVVTLNDGFKVAGDQMLITKANEDINGRTISIEGVEDIAYLYPEFSVAGSTTQSQRTRPTAPTMGDSSIVFFEHLHYPVLQLAITPSNANCNGWNIFRSYDGNSYTLVGTSRISGITSGEANASGTLQSSMRSYPVIIHRPNDWLIASIGTVVDFDTAITSASFFSGRKLLKIGNEIIGYHTCVETAVQGTWKITGLIRGMLNTQSVAHSPSESLATLNVNFSYSYRPEDIGNTLYFKAVPFYGTYSQTLANTTAYTHQITGRYQQPLAVSRLRLSTTKNKNTYKSTDAILLWEFCHRIAGYGRGGYGTALWGASEWDNTLKYINVVLSTTGGAEVLNETLDLTTIPRPMGLLIEETDRDGNNSIVVSIQPGGHQMANYAQTLQIEKV